MGIGDQRDEVALARLQAHQAGVGVGRVADAQRLDEGRSIVVKKLSLAQL